MNAVESFIQELPEQQRAIMYRLHELLISNPAVSTKIRYKVPFYDQYKWVCYLNPIKDKSVEIAFIQGRELSNEQGLLNAYDRKQVMGIRFADTHSFPEAAVNEIIQEALILDAHKYKQKKKR